MTGKSTELSEHLSAELGNIKIPPRPSVMANIQHEMSNPAPNFNTLEAIISLDVGISASLIKIANSAFFGFNGQARSVKDSLQILGLQTVATTIAALSLRKAFSHVPNLERYWDSSGRTAQLSGWLVTQIGSRHLKVRPEEAYTFGLFRDCGIPVLMSMYADYYDILKAANNERIRSFTEIEDDEMGLNHASIGATLAEEWQLPIEFQAAIKSHHDSSAIQGMNAHIIPDASRHFMAISQLAEYLFQQLTGMNKTCEWEKLGDVCSAILNIDGKEGTDRLFKRAQEERIHTYPVI